MKFIVKKDIYEGKILDIWQTVKECAEDMGVKSPSIIQSIKVGCKCKNYRFERIEIPKGKILEIIKT